MNKIVDRFLLTGDKFMPELHLKQPGFTYSTCGPITKHCERIQKFRETDNLRHLHGNKVDKTCFAYNAPHSDSKDLAKRTISDKILRDRAHETARNYNYYGYQKAFASMIYKFLDKKTGLGINVKEQLAEGLHKPVIKTFKRKKVHARFRNNIWAADLAEMKSFSSKNKNVEYLLCVIDVFTRYSWVTLLKTVKQFLLVLLK